MVANFMFTYIILLWIILNFILFDYYTSKAIRNFSLSLFLFHLSYRAYV